MEEEEDLFENYDELPEEVRNIISVIDDGGNPYGECERMLQELRPLGYEFDYDLGGTPFNLKKIR
jgi:hypothetical protein|tara:strand:- start:365 stop:559 length:195 start_codon:yes stop_codon:yes gene_type:complete